MKSEQPAKPVLATDLDGTLIPLENHTANLRDLSILSDTLVARDIELVFATGRHFASVKQAIDEMSLPLPKWIICDVGTSVFRYDAQGKRFVADESYQQHLTSILGDFKTEDLAERLSVWPELRKQEAEKQGQFKLSYYADINADQLPSLVASIQRLLADLAAPYTVIGSMDPFTGDGLVDLLPQSVSKAYALQWWAQQTATRQQDIVFAGDSGNDTAALTAGFRAIVVGNASRRVAQTVYKAHRSSGWQNRLYLAAQSATSGVLEGCRWFGLAEPVVPQKLPFGATPVSANETYFRVWAPKRKAVAVEVDGHTFELSQESTGEFSALISDIGPGACYKLQLDNELSRPDPRSYFQPQGVHHASEVIHQGGFPWSDRDWRGVAKKQLVIYELHIGSLTEEGTFESAIESIPSLVDLGITAVEVLPVAQSPGRWNWGYDGVNLFAPRNTFGRPDDFKAFVNACHEAGIAVILDVVYNHLGPEGNYLSDFGPYFSRRHHTPWGGAFNFDGRSARQVRDYVIDNAIYWLREFHLDGLRLDAVHFMHDDSELSILQEIQGAVDEYERDAQRTVHLIAEANVFDRELLGIERNTSPYDAIWCDCLMHAVYSHGAPELRLTHREYRGASDIAHALQLGYIYHGPEYQREEVGQRDGRGNAYISSLVTALQTHDSVGNHPEGKRIHQLTSTDFQRAAAALFLLYPSIPMIFMGEELATDACFSFFADFEDPRLRKAVDKGRRQEYPQHAWNDALAPSNPDAFLLTKISDAAVDHDMRNWYRSLLMLRQRGIQEGWLSPQNLTVDFRPQERLFSIRYRESAETQIAVLCRLTPPGNEEPAPVATAVVDLLLTSLPMNDHEPETGNIVIGRDHAIVARLASA